MDDDYSVFALDSGLRSLENLKGLQFNPLSEEGLDKIKIDSDRQTRY